jgi:hypothetical protein
VNRIIALSLLSFTLFSQVACVAMFSGTVDTVVIKTMPAGKQFKYVGAVYKSGDQLSISKDIDGAFIMVGENYSTKIEVPYEPDPWIVGDCLLLIIFLIPGLIALGVDAASGSWRAYEKPITIAVPDSTPNIGEKVSENKKPVATKNEKK